MGVFFYNAVMASYDYIRLHLSGGDNPALGGRIQPPLETECQFYDHVKDTPEQGGASSYTHISCSTDANHFAKDPCETEVQMLLHILQVAAIQDRLRNELDFDAVLYELASLIGTLDYTQDTDRRYPYDTTGAADCSSLMWRAYEKTLGIEVGTWTGEQLRIGEEVKPWNSDSDVSGLELGDLVFFNWTVFNPDADHVEMYVNETTTIGISGSGLPGDYGVQYHSLTYNVLHSNSWCARRYSSLLP